MEKRLVLFALALCAATGWSGGVPAGRGKVLDLANPGLESEGKGWRIWSEGSGRGRWPGDAHGGASAALIETSNACQRCILVSPGVPGLQSGMRVRVSFFAKWLAGDSTVFVGFHEYVGEVANMRREWPERWRGEIPKDGAWHLIQADVEVPVFAPDERSMLKVRIGLPFARQTHWRKTRAGFEESRYLLDDITVEALSEPVFAPARPAANKAVRHSFDPADPRDDPSRFGVFWTPWRTYCRVPLKTPREYDRPVQEIDEELDAMREAGVRWIRSIWRWDKIEWESGKPDYAFLDDVVDRAWKRGIRFVPCLNTTPRWASTAPAEEAEFRCFPPEQSAWSNFVFQTVSHFKGRVKYWETWNEPNHVYWLGTAEAFCRHHRTAYLAAKAADPQCKILLGAFAGSGASFLDQLLSMGAKDSFDVVSFHPYSGKKEELGPAERMTADVLRVLSEYGCEDRPVWFTEIGWPEDLAPGKGAARRAELLTLLYDHPFPACVEKVFWFPFDTWSKRAPKPGEGGSGLAGVYDGKVVLTPAFEAYRKAAATGGQVASAHDDQPTRYQVGSTNQVPIIQADGKPVRGRLLLAAQGDWKSYRLGPAGAGEGVVDFTFRATGSAAGDAQIRLGFGAQPGVVWLDDVCVTEADGEKPVFGPCAFEGGRESFDRNWTAHGSCGIGIERGEWKTDALKISVPTNTGSNGAESVLRSRSGVTLKEGVIYRVSMRGRADPARRMSVDVGADRGGFQSLLESQPPFASQVRLAAEAGVNLVTTYAGMPWPKPTDRVEWSSWSNLSVQRVLEVNPHAVVIPRSGMEPGYWWRESHPDDVMAWEDGKKPDDPLAKIYGGSGSPMPDVASEAYRREAGDLLAAYIRVMEAKYGDRIGGYHLAGQNTGEWFYYASWGDTYHGYSPASRDAWRRWLKVTYATDVRLAEAWHRPGASIAAADVPEGKRRRAPGFGLLYDPETQRDIIDFNRFQQDMMADTLLHFARIVRRETQGRKLALFFYGYSFEFAAAKLGPAATGHYALRKILQSPDIDGLSAPISYFDRQSGGSGPMMTPLESVRLAGKIWFSEDDTSTHLSTGHPPGSAVRAKNVEESIQLLRRNTVQSALRNSASWWMDLRSRGWFADPGLWEEMRRLEKVDRPMLERPVPFEPETAVLLDEYSMLCVGFNGSRLTAPLIYRGRAELGRLGAPYGQYLLDDFTAGKIGRAKLLVFLNAWNLDGEQRTAIRRHAAGKTRLWCVAPGLMDGRRASVENMTALTGFAFRRLEPLSDRDKARVRATPAGLAAGLEAEWECASADPLFAVTDASAEETLATWPDGSAAVVSRRGTDGSDIFCGIPLVPAALYRAAARVAGVHVYTDPDACHVCANGPFVSLHACRSGQVNVRLPQESVVTDVFSDEKLGAGRELTLRMEKGQTRVLRLAAP